jgi:hypothetical protein
LWMLLARLEVVPFLQIIAFYRLPSGTQCCGYGGPM